MSGLANVLVVCAVVALVIVRQFKAQQITTDRRWWVIPAVFRPACGVADAAYEPMRKDPV